MKAWIKILSLSWMASRCGAFAPVPPPSYLIKDERRRQQQQPTSVSLLSQQWSPKRTHLFSRKNDINTSGRQEYNDDAFGLVFLCGAFVAKDAIFATTFLLLSAAAATSLRNDLFAKTSSIDTKYLLPSIVAGISLVTTLLLHDTLISILPISLPVENPQATIIEVGVCTISLVYGIIRSSNR
jgi:hypothetical protein